MVQKYNDTIAQIKRELADFIICGLKQLQEQKYDGTIRFTYCLGDRPLRNGKGASFKDGGIGLDKLLPSSIIETMSYSRPFWQDYVYDDGKISVSGRQGYKNESNRLKRPQTKEAAVEEIPFTEFSPKELLEVAKQIEDALGIVVT